MQKSMSRKYFSGTHNKNRVKHPDLGMPQTCPRWCRRQIAGALILTWKNFQLRRKDNHEKEKVPKHTAL